MEQEPALGWEDVLGEYASNPPTPRTLGERIFIFRPCSDCKGTGKIVDPLGDERCPACKGTGKSAEVEQEWLVSPCEQRIKAQFESWVRSAAERTIAEADARGDVEEANQLRSTYMGDRGAGYYTWDGRHVRKARSDLPGVRYLLFLLLRRCQPSVTEEVAAEVFRKNPAGAAAAMAWAQGNAEAPVTAGANGTDKEGTEKMPTREEMNRMIEEMRELRKQQKTQATAPATLDT